MHQSPHPRRIVLSTLGSLGDLNPYVGIALELKARGHRPIIATTSVYREKIERLGIGFHRVRPDLPSYDRPEELRKLVEKCVARRAGAAAILKLLILPHLQDIYQDLNDATQPKRCLRVIFYGAHVHGGIRSTCGWDRSCLRALPGGY